MTFTYNNQKFDLILFSLAGSRFYGTHYDAVDSINPLNPEYVSDFDFRGIFVAHPDTKLGLEGHINEIEVKKDADGNIKDEHKVLIDQLNKKLNLDMEYDTDLTLYEIKKFVTLALDNNPNICDILYADDDAVIYENKKGKKLRKKRDIFISKKTKFTFSGYAQSQLLRVKSHNKFITKYPKTNVVLRILKESFEKGEIDYTWITDHFGGDVSSYVSGMKQQDAQKLEKIQTIQWEEFIKKYSPAVSQYSPEVFKNYVDTESKEVLETVVFHSEWDTYRKPQLINYVTAKDLKAHKFPLATTEPHEANPSGNFSTKSVTLKEFLLNEASFRTISKTQYNIFTPATEGFNGGIFARNGALKVNDPEEVGVFVCQLSIDDLNYKKDLDSIQKLWDWRTHRNEKRSVLEEHYGYDTKHCSHLFRLLIGAKNILTTGEYHPRLSGDNLTLVKGILKGDRTYEWIIEESTRLDKELEEFYNSSKLPKTPNHKKANKLLLELSRKA